MLFAVPLCCNLLCQLLHLAISDGRITLPVINNIASWVWENELQIGTTGCGSGQCSSCSGKAANSYGGLYYEKFLTDGQSLTEAEATFNIDYVDLNGDPIDAAWLLDFFGPVVSLRSDSFLAGGNDWELTGASDGLTFGLHDGSTSGIREIFDHGSGQCSIAQQDLTPQTTSAIGNKIPTSVRSNFMANNNREAAIFAFRDTSFSSGRIGLWLKS